MKLWLPRPKEEDLPDSDNPWEPWYDKCFGAIIRAETEKDARQMMAEATSDYAEGKDAWLDEKYSSCVELASEGKTEIIIKDDHWA